MLSANEVSIRGYGGQGWATRASCGYYMQSRVSRLVFFPVMYQVAILDSPLVRLGEGYKWGGKVVFSVRGKDVPRRRRTAGRDFGG